MVRAKFKLTSKTENEGGFVLSLFPVTQGSKENESFYKYTPSGKIELCTINKESAQQFEVGEEYYVDFNKAGD